MDLSAFRNLFGDLQEHVVGILNQDEIIDAMGAKFVSENALDVEYEVKDALAKTGMACVVMTPAATYQGHNGIQQTFTCDELTLQIVENPVVHRPWLKKNNLKYGTGLDVAKAASDRLAGPQGGHFGQFTTKRIREAETGGLLAVTAVFGCTVYETLSAVPSGDISGHWTEIPFVRMSELSDWIDDYLSTHVPVPEVSGYLPLSGGMMTGAISAFSNATTIDWGYDGSLAAGTPGIEIRTAGEDGYYRLPAQDGSRGPSEYDVMRRKDLPSVDVPTKVSELSNDVGYITSAQVVPAEFYYGSILSGYAFRAWQSHWMLPSLDGATGKTALDENAGYLYLLYNDRLRTLFNVPYDWSLSSFQGTQFSPPVTMKYSWWSNVYIRRGNRVQNISRGWGWNGTYGNNSYFIHTAESLTAGYNLPSTQTPDRFYKIAGTTYTSKPITLTENQLSIDTYDGQTGVIECSRLSAGTAEKNNAVPYLDEVVPYNNTSALTVTVPYDHGFTLQTPNGIPLIQTIDLNRTSINSLSAGSVEVGQGGVTTFPGAGVDTTKLSAWNWIKTGETGLGGIISGEHNSILGEVSEDFVSFNWLIQQGYATSADISAELGRYLPLSGGQMAGGIGWDYGGSGGPRIDGPWSPQQLAFSTTYADDQGKQAFLDFGRISANGQYTIAYVEDIQAALGDISALIHES